MADAEILTESLKPLALELEYREPISGRIEVIDYHPDPASDQRLFAPGTITVLIARRQNRLLLDLRDSLSTGSHEKVLEIRTTIADGFSKRPSLSLDDAVALACDEENIGEVRYFGTPVARSLIVPDPLGFAAVTLPFNGGILEDGDLTSVQYVKYKSDVELAFLAIKHEPSLTEAEAAALAAVPSTSVGRGTIGSASRCWALTAVGIAAAVVIVTSFCPVIIILPLIDPVQHLSPEEIKRLGPSNAARQLLRIRREELKKLAGKSR